MDTMFLMAETATKVVAEEVVPAWGKYALGPLGATVILLVYTVWTEKFRIPTFRKIIDDMTARLDAAQQKYEDLHDKFDQKKDEIRKGFEEREAHLEKEIHLWRDRHTKEKSSKSWFKAKAEGAYERLGEKMPDPPRDVDKTHYGDS